MAFLFFMVVKLIIKSANINDSSLVNKIENGSKWKWLRMIGSSDQTQIKKIAEKKFICHVDINQDIECFSTDFWG